MLNGEKIHPQLFCPICEKVFYGPVVISCGHSFCNICIALWMRRQSDCPVCKRRLQNFETRENLVAAKIIADSQTKCCHPSCKWTGCYKQLKRHQRKCQFGPKKEISQIPADHLIDLVEDQPKWVLSEKKSIANEFSNSKILNFNFNFTKLPNTHFLMMENYQPFLMASRYMTQAQYFNFQYFHEDQQEGDSDSSRGVILNDEEYQKAHSRPPNSIFQEGGATCAGSSLGSERKQHNDATVSKGLYKKQEKIIINFLNRELENQHYGPQRKYNTKNVIQLKQNSPDPQNPLGPTNTRSRSRNKEKAYPKAHSKPQCPNTITGPTNVSKKQHLKPSDGRKA